MAKDAIGDTWAALQDTCRNRRLKTAQDGALFQWHRPASSSGSRMRLISRKGEPCPG